MEAPRSPTLDQPKHPPQHRSRHLSGLAFERLETIPKYKDHLLVDIELQAEGGCYPYTQTRTLKLLEDRKPPDSPDSSNRNRWRKLLDFFNRPSDLNKKLRVIATGVNEYSPKVIMDAVNDYGIVMGKFHSLAAGYPNTFHVVQITDVVSLEINGKDETCVVLMDFADMEFDSQTNKPKKKLPDGKKLSDLEEKPRREIIQSSVRVCHLPSLLKLNELSYAFSNFDPDKAPGDMDTDPSLHAPQLWAPAKVHEHLKMPDADRREFTNELQNQISEIEFFETQIAELSAKLKAEAPRSWERFNERDPEHPDKADSEPRS